MNNAILDIEPAPLRIKSKNPLKQLEFEEAIIEAMQERGINSLHEAGNRFFLFDLSESYWIDLGALLWLIPLLHRLRLQGSDIQLVFPEPDEGMGGKLWDALIRWQFFEALEQCVDDPANLLRLEQLPYLKRVSQYRRGEKGFDEFGKPVLLRTLQSFEIKTIITKVGRSPFEHETEHGQFGQMDQSILAGALSSKCGWDPSVAKRFVGRVVREGIQNSFLHANGTFVNVAYRIDNTNLTLAISDNGAGIPQVLRTALGKAGIQDKLCKSSDAALINYFTEPEMILDVQDSSLIEFSTEEGVSSDPERSGVGLYYLKSQVLRQGGELRIRSGAACVDFTVKKQSARDGLPSSPGTLLRIIIPLRTTEKKPKKEEHV
jgi:hypothetical protein